MNNTNPKHKKPIQQPGSFAGIFRHAARLILVVWLLSTTFYFMLILGEFSFDPIIRMPLLIQLAIVIIAWKYERLGGAILLLLGVLLICILGIDFDVIRHLPGFAIIHFMGIMWPPIIAGIFLLTIHSRLIPYLDMKKGVPESVDDVRLLRMRDIARSIALIWLSTFMFIMLAILYCSNAHATGYGITIVSLGLILVFVTLRIAWKRELVGGIIILIQGLVFLFIFWNSDSFNGENCLFDYFKFFYFLGLFSSLLSGVLFILYSRQAKKS